MKTRIFLAVLLLISFSAKSQLQIFGKYTPKDKDSNSEFAPDINIFGYGSNIGKFKTTYFLLVEKNWAEGLIGLNYSPKDWIEFGISLGIEQSPKLLRGGVNLSITYKKFFFFSWIEKGIGKDNYWYKSSLNYSFNKTLSLEAVAWRFNGIGLSLKVKTFKEKVTLWVFPAWDPEFHKKRISIGMDIKLN